MQHEHTIWTIGHSTHTLEEFVAMLQSFSIKLLVDIRSFPGSRKYTHLKDLGGRRKVRKDSTNTAWRHPAFRGYADYMETPEFAAGIQQLEEMAKKKATAYMCSEAVWWSCHRSMVSDYLKVRGWKVMHIMSVGKADEHPYTSPARIVDGQLTYKDEQQLF